MAEKLPNIIKSINPQIKEGKQMTTLNFIPSKSIFQKQK